jgi:hypothetical protein
VGGTGEPSPPSPSSPQPTPPVLVTVGIGVSGACCTGKPTLQAGKKEGCGCPAPASGVRRARRTTGCAILNRRCRQQLNVTVLPALKHQPGTIHKVTVLVLPGKRPSQPLAPHPSCIADEVFKPLSLLIGHHRRGHPCSGEGDPYSSGGAVALPGDDDRGRFSVGCQGRQRPSEHLVWGTHLTPPGNGGAVSGKCPIPVGPFAHRGDLGSGRHRHGERRGKWSCLPGRCSRAPRARHPPWSGRIRPSCTLGGTQDRGEPIP